MTLTKELREKSNNLMVSPTLGKVLKLVMLMRDDFTDDKAIKHTSFIEIVEHIDKGEITFTCKESEAMLHALLAKTFMEISPDSEPHVMNSSVN